MIIWADFPSGQHGLYGSDGSLMLNGIWAETSSAGSYQNLITTDPDPNIASDGRVLRMDAITASSGDSSEQARMALPAEVGTLGLGFRMWLSKLPTTNGMCPAFAFRTNANSGIVTIWVSTTGQIIAYAGGNSDFGSVGTELGRSSPVLTANAWQHVETKATSGAGTGEVEIRVNGVTVLDLTGLTLSASDIAQFSVGCHENAGSADGAMIAYYKDLVVWDTTGSEGNDFQGSVAVHDLYTDADIALNWTPSTGSTGWDLIDEIPPVDTDYIQAGDPAPDPAKFSLTNLPDDVTSVRALIPIVRAVKTDGGDCNIQVGLTPNDTNWDDGADRPITTAYTYWWDVSHLSPATAAPWTPAEVNAAYVRADRTL